MVVIHLFLDHKATGFSDTSGAYISLTVGLSVSTVAFLVEVTLKGVSKFEYNFEYN